MSATIELTLNDQGGDFITLCAAHGAPAVDVTINDGDMVQLDAGAVKTLIEFLQGYHKALLP